jgi:hypothetical protein
MSHETIALLVTLGDLPAPMGIGPTGEPLFSLASLVAHLNQPGDTINSTLAGSSTINSTRGTAH